MKSPLFSSDEAFSQLSSKLYKKNGTKKLLNRFLLRHHLTSIFLQKASKNEQVISVEREKEISVMKVKVNPGVVGIIILVLGVYTGINFMSSSARAFQTSDPIGMSHLSQTKPKSVGIPAIFVKDTARQEAPNTPRISKTDVENYVKIHSFQGGSAVSETTPKVVAITYITSKKASQLLKNDSIGLADTAMVYYVQWQGPFNPTYGSAPRGAILPTSVPKGVEIFDAQTGNLLLSWMPNN